MKKVFIINPKIHWKKQVQWMKSIKSAFQGEDILIEKTKGIGMPKILPKNMRLKRKTNRCIFFLVAEMASCMKL